MGVWEEVQLPSAAPEVNRSGRTLKLSHFTQPVTLPFHLWYAKGRDTCHSFCGPTKANYNYQGATCFWPALSLKQKPENKDRRLPGYSSQNHKLSNAVGCFPGQETRTTLVMIRVLELCHGHICGHASTRDIA